VAPSHPAFIKYAFFKVISHINCKIAKDGNAKETQAGDVRWNIV